MFAPLQSFLEKISYIASIEDLNSLIKDMMDAYGLNHFLGMHVYGLKCIPDRKPMFGHWDTDWVKHYIQQGYYRLDPVGYYPRGINEDYQPYFWSDLLATKELTKGQCRIFSDAWDAGLKEGIVFPLPIGDELSIVSVAGEKLKKGPVIQGILHTIAIQCHWKARAILIEKYEDAMMPNVIERARSPRFDEITATERQVITMLADDRRAPEIAVLLDVSVNTVRKHIASAKKKLEVDHSEGLVIVAKRYKVII